VTRLDFYQSAPSAAMKVFEVALSTRVRDITDASINSPPALLFNHHIEGRWSLRSRMLLRDAAAPPLHAEGHGSAHAHEVESAYATALPE